MARGDVHFFASFELKAKSGVAFNLTSDALKMGIVTSATQPTAATLDPRWGAGGTTNFSANECAHATAYTGPIALSSVIYAGLVASFTGSISANVLNVATMGSGTVAVGQTITGASMIPCVVTGYLTGTGGTGTYVVSVSQTVSSTAMIAGGINKLSASNITVAQDAGGFTDGAYGIIYDDTVSGKYAIGYVDLGGPVSLLGGALAITWNALGIGIQTAT